MHDYHKAKQMVDYATTKARKLGKKKVTKIVIKIGDSSGYSSDSVVMYFNEVSAGTICEGAFVEVEAVKSMLQCPKCGEIFPRKLMHYDCPVCGKEGLPSRIGTEIEIVSIETEPAIACP